VTIMSAPAPVTSPAQGQAKDTQPLDLAALGQTWTPPPQALDLTPEVSDVLADMPWWAARGLLYLIVGFLIVALLWAHFSVVDVIIESRGTLVPEGYGRPVQAVGGGLVQYVLVREGEAVERGQALMQLDATESRTRLNKLREELAISQEQLRQLRALKGPVAETLEQENRLTRLQSEMTALELSLKYTTITAPTSGVVTTLDVRSAGTVLQAGQRIATLAPAGARLVVEAQVPNKDIAFVEKGLPAKLKFDAFPFQDYGIVSGTIVEVAPDAQPGKEAGSFYKVMIAPEQTGMVAKGKTIPLRPGLTLTAEIVTERKSILNLILEPFRKLVSERASVKRGYLADVPGGARLVPGMAVNVHLPSATATSTCSVPRVAFPAAAELRRGAVSTLFVLDHDRMTARPVLVEAIEGDQVEVSSGLTVGDRVILAPPAELKTGAFVRAK